MRFIDKLRVAWRERASILSIAHATGPGFSQFGEDLLFAKLLNPGEHGTYVDVGAHHPIHGSNTFRLYLRGWNGLAIDPNPQFADAFRTYRQRDTHLMEGVSLEPAVLTYFAFEESVFNTFENSRAEMLIRGGCPLISRTQVPCRPLSDIVDQHLGDQQIDLLNVDCEGLDIEVLESLDLTKRRPTVIIVEDFDRFFTFQRNTPTAKLETLLRKHHYLPLAQMAWSGMYIAEDCRRLFTRSNAFQPDWMPNGYLP